MDVKSVILVHVFTLALVTNVISTSGCREVLNAIGTNAQFTFFSKPLLDSPTSLLIVHKHLTYTSRILNIKSYSGRFKISPSDTDTDRVIINGYVKYPEWNISITLIKVSRGDEGLFEVIGDPKPAPIAKFCLYVLDLPAMYLQGLSSMKNGIIAAHGGCLVISGMPAKILPNNSHYDIKMTWLLNDNVLHTGGIFTVHEDTIIIAPVTDDLHGATVTYLATVVGHDDTTSVTNQLVIVPRILVDLQVTLHPVQSFYVINEHSSIPDIKCDVASNLSTHVSWPRGEHVVANHSLLSLGRVDHTMSGEYTCIAMVMITGLSKEKSLHILVNEKHENQLFVAIVILSSLNGLLVTAFVVMVIVMCRKRGIQTDLPSRDDKRSLQMAVYTDLQERKKDPQLYDTPDSLVTRETPSSLLQENRVYDEACTADGMT